MDIRCGSDRGLRRCVGGRFTVEGSREMGDAVGVVGGCLMFEHFLNMCDKRVCAPSARRRPHANAAVWMYATPDLAPAEIGRSN